MAKGLSLLRRAGLGLGAIAAGAAYDAFVGGNRAHSAIAADRGLPMASTFRSSRRVPSRFKARRTRRSFNIPRRRFSSYRSLVRSTTSVPALAVPVGGFAATTYDCNLSNVYTTDLIAMYRQFRIRKVVAVITPRVSPANSGIANNFATGLIAGCNPDGQAAAPATFNEVCQFPWRSKHVTGADDKLIFTFYPKALNVINGAAGAAVSAGGYASNPWITLNATGIAVPHKQLLIAGQNAGVALSFDMILHYYFDVR